MQGENRKQEDIRVVYQGFLDAIEYSKSQQWLATYYFLLVQGAMIGLVTLFLDKDLILLWKKYAPIGFFLLALLLAVFGTMRILDLQLDLGNYRIRVDHGVRRVLSVEAEGLLSRDVSTTKYLSGWSFFDRFLLTFLGAIWIGTILVVMVINANQYSGKTWATLNVQAIIIGLFMMGFPWAYYRCIIRGQLKKAYKEMEHYQNNVLSESGKEAVNYPTPFLPAN